MGLALNRGHRGPAGPDWEFDRGRIYDYLRPEPQTWRQVFLNTLMKVRMVVGEFFLNVFQFLFCIPQLNQRIEPCVGKPPPQFCVEPNLNDLPVDLEPLKAVLRAGEGAPQISSRMTPDDFSKLCKDYPIRVQIRKRIGQNALGETEYGPVLEEVAVQELQLAQPAIEAVKQNVAEREGINQANLVEPVVIFPRERRIIADWAIAWASGRSPKVDPEHPYFQIVQAAFQHKNNIDGGNHSSDDYTTYSPINDTYYSYVNLFTYIIYSLIGFQELNKNIDLFNKLDNWSLVNGQNPAYRYATAVSKIFTYPKAFGGNQDVRHKLQNGLGVAWAAFEWARDRGQEDDYFTQCFTGAYCFDARLMPIQEFILHNMHPNFDDFNAAVIYTDTVDTKIAKHFAAFKHQQIDLYVREHPLEGLSYEQMKRELNAGVNTHYIQDFLGNYCTFARFLSYLDQNNQPIKERKKAIAGEEPRIAGIELDPRKPFIQIANIDLIPPAQRVVGESIALRDPRDRDWYKVRVHQVGPNQIELDLRGDTIEQDKLIVKLEDLALI